MTCGRITFIILSIAIFTGGIIGSYHIIKYTNNYINCNVTKILNRECYEIRGKGVLLMTQYVEINHNYTAGIFCGKVVHCETSPCQFNVVMYNIYGCSYQSENYYILPNYPYGLYIFAAGLIFCAIATPMILMFLVYRFNREIQSESTPLLI